jgi:mannose-6-phosphate isomerase-like protein (cupin superfamily)
LERESTVAFNRKSSSHLYQEQETLWYLGGQRIVQALGERMPAGLEDLTEFVAPARAHVFTYRLTAEDEAIYATEGNATMTCGELTFPVSAGMLLFLPCGISHHLEVGPNGHFHYLRWMTPDGFAHEVTRMGIPGQPLVLAPPACPDGTKVQQLAQLLRAAAHRQGAVER